MTGDIKGDILIDIGSGAAIYTFLSACESFTDIIATDYTDRNRQELKLWLIKEPEAFDWSAVVKLACELEGDRWCTGDTLLDICIFPILSHLYPACNSFKEIITTNFLEQNRQEIESWLKNEKGAFDWSATMKLICELEGNRDTEPEIEAKLRKKVKCVLKSDVTQNNPLDPLVQPAVDCLITCLCLEFACKDKDTFCCALNNISSMLKQGGYLILVGALGCTDYMLGERKFFTLSLDKEFLEKVIPECGYDILQLQTLIIPNPDPQSIATYKGYFFILARKQA